MLVGTLVEPIMHFEHCLRKAGLWREARHLTAYLNSSHIPVQNDC